MVAVLAAIGFAAPAGAGGGWSDLEAQFVARINQLRASQGLSALEVHPNLVGKARSWAGTMAGEDRIWHSNLPDGITADWHTLGENVGMGPSVESLHDAFVASPSHYENLVKPEFEYVGVGVVVNADGTIFVAEEFMTLRPSAQPAPPVPAPPAADDTPSPSSAAGGSGDTAAPVRARPVASTSAPATPAPPTDRIAVVLRHLRALDG